MRTITDSFTLRARNKTDDAVVLCSFDFQRIIKRANLAPTRCKHCKTGTSRKTSTTSARNFFNVYHAKSSNHIFILPFFNPQLATQQSAPPFKAIHLRRTSSIARPRAARGGVSCRPLAQSHNMQRKDRRGRRAQNDGKPSICCLTWILTLQP